MHEESQVYVRAHILTLQIKVIIKRVEEVK